MVAWTFQLGLLSKFSEGKTRSHGYNHFVRTLRLLSMFSLFQFRWRSDHFATKASDYFGSKDHVLSGDLGIPSYGTVPSVCMFISILFVMALPNNSNLVICLL